MLIRSAMVSKPLIVDPGDTLLAFIDKVLASNQTTAAVVTGDRLVGIVSVKDIYRRIVPPYVDPDSQLMSVVHEGYFDEKFQKFQRTTVQEIMTTDVETVSPNEAVIHAVALFVQGRKSLPVIEHGRFIGIITRRSILRTVRDSVER